MPIARVRTTFSGAAGSPWLSTAYFEVTAPYTANLEVAAVGPLLGTAGAAPQPGGAGGVGRSRPGGSRCGWPAARGRDPDDLEHSRDDVHRHRRYQPRCVAA